MDCGCYSLISVVASRKASFLSVFANTYVETH